jgi:hypothetical protein
MHWARLQTNVHPELRLLYAIPNGGYRTPITASRMKAEGVKAGVPDLHLGVARQGFLTLYIEMKVPKSPGKAAGRTSDEQHQWIIDLQNEGHRVEVAYGWEQAKDILLDYLMN